MHTDETWRTRTETAEETITLAVRLGRALRGGETIELSSDLGGGKTTFTRGLVRGAGSADKVASPTFTISRVYETKAGRVHHFDFYRLPEPGLMATALREAVDDPQDIVVVEWGAAVHDVLPKDRLTITFEQAEVGRTMTFHAPEKLAYLIEAVRN
jgi:tRNA threonylcarbamoyladenosine biosynthesis protein TsaE